MENRLQQLYKKLCLCSVFRRVLNKPLLQAFERYCLAEGSFEQYKSYAAFVAEIYEGGGSLTELTFRLVAEDENVFIKGIAQGKTSDKNVESAALREIEIFTQLGGLTVRDFAYDMCVREEELPAFTSVNADMADLYMQRLQNLDKFGYGIFSSVGCSVCPTTSK